MSGNYFNQFTWTFCNDIFRLNSYNSFHLLAVHTGELGEWGEFGEIGDFGELGELGVFASSQDQRWRLHFYSQEGVNNLDC